MMLPMLRLSPSPSPRRDGQFCVLEWQWRRGARRYLAVAATFGGVDECANHTHVSTVGSKVQRVVACAVSTAADGARRPAPFARRLAATCVPASPTPQQLANDLHFPFVAARAKVQASS